MTLKTKKTTVFAHKQAAVGTPFVLTGAHAMRTHGAKCTPFAATEIKRDLDAQGFGSTGTIHAGPHQMVEFDIEMAGSGVVGTRPAYGDLFMACAMSETIVAVTSVTYAPASGTTKSGGDSGSPVAPTPRCDSTRMPNWIAAARSSGVTTLTAQWRSRVSRAFGKIGWLPVLVMMLEWRSDSSAYAHSHVPP